MLRLPTVIQSKSGIIMGWLPPARNALKVSSDKTKLPTTVREPIIPTAPFGKCGKPSPLIRNPIRGSNGIRTSNYGDMSLFKLL